jgi:HEAT repeat protein
LLLLALEHENIAAAEALGTIADAKAVDPLIAALNCRSSTMRKVAAKSLGQIKDKRAVEPLVKLLADKKSEVQEAAMNALVNFDLTVVLPSLLLALKEKKHEVRYAAEKVIGMFGDPRAVEPLATMLGNKNLDILARLAALRALGQIDDVRSLEPLVAELVNKDISLHKAAIETLGLRKGSVSALGQSRRLQLVEVLIRVLTDLKDPDCGVRNIAAEILGEIGDKTSVSAKLNYCEII